VFKNFNREVNVSGYDPSGETKSLRIFSAALGYVIPQSGKTVFLTIHQGVHLPHLEHNFLSTMQIRLHDVIVNETPKLQCLEPTNLSSTIIMIGDNVYDVLCIPLDLHGVVSCFETFNPTQE
jgi:hypothetical protein